VIPQASSKLDSSEPPYPGGCPRCGTRITRNYKYCPNCSYRLRPDLAGSRGQPDPQATTGQRVLALGGYLAFASLLLLVVWTGFELFSETDVFLGVTEQTGVLRDANALAIDPHDGFLDVPGGEAIFGPPDLPENVILVDDPFRLAIHEVTNDQYFGFMLARARRNGDPVPARLYPRGWSRLTGNRLVARIYDRGRGDHPVTAVDFRSATEFCNWLWTDRFGADPNVIIDLPTASEWMRAARRDVVDQSFPWENEETKGLRPGFANLDGKPRPVTDKQGCGVHRGFVALIGNAAEWVRSSDGPASAGWSFEDGGYYDAWDNPYVRAKPTPFSGVEPVWRSRAQPHLGFRVVVRATLVLPTFVTVDAGRAWHTPQTPDPDYSLTPPYVEKQRRSLWRRGTRIVFAPDKPVSFRSEAEVVRRTFEIARSEITNHQYLAFLSEEASNDPEDLAFLPKSFVRLHPNGDWAKFTEQHNRSPTDIPEAEFHLFAEVERLSTTFPGPHGDPRRVPYIYEAGAANRPVMGIRIEQAGRYAEWLSRKLQGAGRIVRLPTVAEFLRAGRGEGASPYPWGDNALDSRLICAGRRDDEQRPVSWLRFESERIFGLAGNLPEWVHDERQSRDLLAGGFFRLPPAYCTLDTFFDSSWESVVLKLPDDEGKSKIWLAQYAGFRVVRVARF